MSNERRWLLQSKPDNELSADDLIIKYEKVFIKKFLPVHAKEVRTTVGGRVGYIKVGYTVKKRFWHKFGETNSVIINQAKFDQWRANLALLNFVNGKRRQS